MVMLTEELTSDRGAPLVSVFGAYCAKAGAAPAVDIEQKSDGAPERPMEYRDVKGHREKWLASV